MRLSDQEWIQHLNRVRAGQQTVADIQRVYFFLRNRVPASTQRLCHRKKEVMAFNTKLLESKPIIATSYAESFLAKTPELPQKDISFTGNMRFALPLAIQNYYMVTSNVEKEDGNLNGSIGVLKAVSTK